MVGLQAEFVVVPPLPKAPGAPPASPTPPSAAPGPKTAASLRSSVVDAVTPQVLALTLTWPPWSPAQVNVVPLRAPRFELDRVRKDCAVTSLVEPFAYVAVTVNVCANGVPTLTEAVELFGLMARDAGATHGLPPPFAPLLTPVLAPLPTPPLLPLLLSPSEMPPSRFVASTLASVTKAEPPSVSLWEPQPSAHAIAPIRTETSTHDESLRRTPMENPPPSIPSCRRAHRPSMRANRI